MVSPASCSDPVSLKRKTSWTFKQSLYSRKNSGGPGYLKAHKLLTGTMVKNENVTYVSMAREPFRLRGSDN
jgi:hypothetical protein